MAFQGRALKTRLAIVLGLSMGGVLLAIWSGVNLTQQQDRLDLQPPNTVAPNDAEQYVASESLDSLLDEEPRAQAPHHCSGVHATYTSATDGVGYVALVGPMRMAYSTALAAVRSAAHHLDYLLN